MIALRIDDIGASSKRYEVYSNYAWRFGRLRLSGNFLFLKYVSPFKKWGPYREMTAPEWHAVFGLLEKHNARLTAAVTATWAEDEHALIPFPKKFPDESAALREGVQQGLLEIANHGLTHCVLQNNVFKPKLLSGNRMFHREFWEWVPADVQKRHIDRAQEILQGWFQKDVITFVPPGNVFCDTTLELASRAGLRYISCAAREQGCKKMVLVGDEHVLAFHDRDIVLQGIGWLEEKLQRSDGEQLYTVSEIGERLSKNAEAKKSSNPERPFVSGNE